MLITLIVILGLAVLILGHEFGHFLVAKWSGMKVDEFGIGFPPKLWKKKIGETEYSVNALPFGGFVKIAGENDGVMSQGMEMTGMAAPDRKKYFAGQPAWRRSAVILAGVAMNFLLGWVMLSLVFMVGTGPNLVIGGVEPGSPAEAAGLKRGDIVQGFPGTQQFIEYVRAHAGREITVQIKRAEEFKEFKMTPRANVGPDQGPLGVEFGGIPRFSPLEAMKAGFLMTWEMVRLTFAGFKELAASLFAHGSVPQDIVGPVGIFGIAQDAGRMGLIYLLELLAFISINLGVINLIPFPALDGGRFMLILIEKLKGSPIPRKVESAVNALGFVLLILLMIVVTIRDVIRL